jgi:phospholipid/cholesterol/gamma-HCH transport system ATP-binding protein
MSDLLFTVRGLHKAYGGRAVLRGLDFDVRRGECFVILGRSGSGKSVTLRQLDGLERPDAGSIRFAGEETSGLGERDLRSLRRRVAMLFQSGALFDSLDVFDNVAFPLREHTALRGAELERRVRELLAMVRLPDVERRMPADLSGGMRKRVALARSLALAPEVVLFDEPTSGLDPMTAASIAQLIERAQQSLGVPPVVVTHDLALARRVAGRVAFLDGGRLRFVGTWDAAQGADDPLLAAFLAGREPSGGAEDADG